MSCLPSSQCKGIILAGGDETRLHPIVKLVSKQLLPVFGKPMNHYPLSTFILGTIYQELLIINPHEQPAYGGSADASADLAVRCPGDSRYNFCAEGWTESVEGWGSRGKM